MDDEARKVANDFMEKRADVLYDLAAKLTTLSAGSLALTVTFRRDLLSGDDDRWMLKGAWCGFMVVIFAFVLLYFARMEIYRRSIKSAIRGDRVITGTPPWYFRLAFRSLCLGFLIGVGFLALYGFRH